MKQPIQTICLYARSGQNELYAKVGQELEKRGIPTAYIVQNPDEERVVRAYQPQGNVYNLTAFLKQNWDNASLLQSLTLSGIEQKYDIDSLWRLVYADRFLVKYSHADTVKFIKLHVAFIEEIAERENIGALINEGVALFSSYMFFYAARWYGFRYLSIIIPRNFAYEKFYFSSHLHGRNEELDEYYKNRELNTDELAAARELIDDLVANATKPEYIKVSRLPKVNLDFVKGLVRYLLSFARPVSRQNYEFYHERSDMHLYQIKNYFKYLRQRRFYQVPDFKQPYYFLPLHYQPEATTLVDAANYEKQALAVDLVAKKIPGEAVLYVKEHHWHVGHREMSFYTGLKRYPNVRLINPWEDSHRLIRHSRGVIVLTSTVGWEAMMYRVPVFLLGRVFYESFAYIQRIENIDHLSAALRSLADNWPSEEIYDLELTRYVAAYLKSLHRGNYYLGDPGVVSRENVELLTNEIIRKVHPADVCEDQVRQHH